MPLLIVRKAGFMTTLQDLGRFGLGRFGVPQSGAMDALAFRAANRLVGNEDNAPALELTAVGPEIEFRGQASFALSGANLTPVLNDRPLTLWHSHVAKSGEVLRFGARRQGSRCYLAVAGGFRAQKVMASVSTDMDSRLGGLDGGPIRAGVELEVGPQTDQPQRRARPDLPRQYANPFEIRFIADEESGFSRAAMEKFQNSRYQVSRQSDRMGYRLHGPSVSDNVTGDMISGAIPPGTVQILPGGEPILLMADGQGVGGGGYPRIGYVIRADLPKAGQLWVGNSVRFCETTLEAARSASQLQELILDQAIRF